MRTIDIETTRTRVHGIPADDPERPNRRCRLAAMIRAVLLFSSLAGIQAIHAQELPLLQTLPVTVLAGNFVGAGDGRQFTLSGWTADKGFMSLSTATTDVDLKNITSPSAVPNESNFVLLSYARSHNALMLINLIATTRRCLVTGIDPVLNQAHVAGRVIEVSSTMIKAPAYLSESSNPVTLCTMDSGKLSLYFSTPALNMVQLTAVSYANLSGTVRAMNSQSTMLYFPLRKL